MVPPGLVFPKTRLVGHRGRAGGQLWLGRAEEEAAWACRASREELSDQKGYCGD